MVLNRKKTEQKYSVDQMMRNVASSLVRDFRDNLQDPEFCSGLDRDLLYLPIAQVRELLPTPTEEMDIAHYKAMYQIESVMKRYRFETDTYSDEELTVKAITSFIDTQTRLASLDLHSLPAKTQRVLDLAARYIAKVLGVYDGEQHRNLCRFGRKASVGVPARLACEAARWELPISGSREQIRWFDSEMSQYECIQNYWMAQLDSDPERSIYNETSSLALTLVPKTFKSLRSIMPNTTIGSYQSYGLGEMIRKRLKKNGYDIRSLQMRHRFLARRASSDSLLTTADLSSASDSITVALVERLFPADWFEALNLSRIKDVSLPFPSEEGAPCVQIESLTFCTMGIGYTFPLQTLVFLSLLKAIESVTYHTRRRRTISVYGDDLIYPSTMHNNVIDFMQQVGFVFNVDKTFNTGFFRESCGGDYYHGVDVRPFQPRNGQAYVGSHTYEAILYKYVNGLLARWSEYEIERTLDYLTSEIRIVTGKAKIVPEDYPDDAGIKCSHPAAYEFLSRTSVASLKSLGHGVYRFSYLGLKSNLREETRHEPYLWLALRGQSPPIYHHDSEGPVRESRRPMAHRIDDICGVRVSDSPLVFQEVKPIKTFRSCITGRRLRRKAAYVTVSHTGRYTRQSGTSCFGVRR